MRIWQRQFVSIFFSLNILSAGVPLRGGARSPAIGVILTADRAQLSGASAGAGATIFDGDRLSTDVKGSLRVRAGVAQLQLASGSTATLKQTSRGVSATVVGGTLAVATTKGSEIELRASDARIRSRDGGVMHAEVTFVSAKEVLVTSRRGTLEIVVDEDTQIVAEATSYRALIDEPGKANGPTAKQDRSRSRGRGASGTMRSAGRNRFVLMALVVTGVATIFAVDEMLESPANP
jgi:hypothetical protein